MFDLKLYCANKIFYLNIIELQLENQISNNQQIEGKYWIFFWMSSIFLTWVNTIDIIATCEVDSKYLLRKGWTLRENQIFEKWGEGKRMSNKVKKMLERMFLLGNLNPKDCMNAKDMYERLKKFQIMKNLKKKKF